MKKIWIDVRWFFIRLGMSIKNVIRWLPVIWRDKDWDESFIYKILQFKLKNQSEYIATRDWHTRAKRDAEIMMTCVRLIDKINEQYYGMEYFEYYDYDMSTDNPNRFLEFNVTRDELDTYYAKYPLTFKKIVAQYGDAKDRSSTALLMGDDRQEKARKLLFKILEQNIETWWD
jgi:hypothetical protein